MIRLVRGIVVLIGTDHLVLEIGSSAPNASFGVGLKIFTPQPTLARLTTDSTLLLHTYLQVREDALTLYGFEHEDELAVFELLLGVSGVGPKVALAVLSTLSPDALRLALVNDEPAVIARVPGIGKRTAQKIIVELKDKVEQPDGDVAVLAQATEADSEVIDALVALGYSVVEAQRAVQNIPADAVGVEERLRLALSQFDS